MIIEKIIRDINTTTLSLQLSLIYKLKINMFFVLKFKSQKLSIRSKFCYVNFPPQASNWI